MRPAPTPLATRTRLSLLGASLAMALIAGACGTQTPEPTGPETTQASASAAPSIPERAATQKSAPVASATDHDEPAVAATAPSPPEADDTAARSEEAEHQALRSALAEARRNAPHARRAPRSAPAPAAAPAPASRPHQKSASSASGHGVGSLGLSGLGQGGGGYGRGMVAGRGVPMRLYDVHREHPGFHTEGYDHITESAFRAVGDHPLSTFSVDVDTASYSNVRRFLRDGQLPPKDAVRIEELVNYFSYDYPEPQTSQPFSVTTEVSACPWEPKHRLVHVGLRGKSIAQDSVPPRNLVFLIDVSGSMRSGDKLPLLKHGLSLLARNLRPEDSVAIVVYAGASGLALAPTSGRHQNDILAALDQLYAGGSTNGADGIRLAYQVAQRSMKKGGINRVILATDGDFNVGTTSRSELQRLIEDERKTGIFLTVLGFGRGNVKDSTMEALADKGNGNYAYIDSAAEARKVLVREAGATLVTIAKDVKLQVEFNPALVQSYRLIGYENRVLAKEDFNDDNKDAGEIGAGHTVTALYEIVPKGAAPEAPKVDPLKYQKEGALTPAAQSPELATVKLRYKAPHGNRSTLTSVPIVDRGARLDNASADYRFSAAVAGFGMLLRGSEHKGKATLGAMRALAESALSTDATGDRQELLALMDRAQGLGLH